MKNNLKKKTRYKIQGSHYASNKQQMFVDRRRHLSN